MADNASRDQNNVPTLLGVSSTDGVSPVKVYADPSTHRLLVNGTGGGVTSINADTTAAQVIAAGTGITVTDNGTGTHTIAANQNTTGNKIAPAGSVVIMLGDSYSAGYPYITYNATFGYATGSTGLGTTWPQYLSSTPFFAGVPVYSYGIVGATAGDANVGISAILAATNANYIHGTQYLNGSVVGSYGGVTSKPQTLAATFAGTVYWVTEYGINDSGGTSTSSYIASMQAGWTTINGYSGTNKIYTMTVPMCDIETPARSQTIGTYNLTLRGQINNTSAGINGIIDAGFFFNNQGDVNVYYSDHLHLNSTGYYALANITANAVSTPYNPPLTIHPLRDYDAAVYFNGGINLGKNGNPIYVLADTSFNYERIQNDGSGMQMATFTGGHLDFGTLTKVSSNPVYTSLETMNATGLSFNVAGTGVIGGITSTLPNAGIVGEQQVNSVPVGSAVSLTTATPANVCSKSLTAGHWLVSFNANTASTAATMIATAPLTAGISTTSATLPTNGTEGYSGVNITVAGSTNSVQCSPIFVNVTTTTTVYGVVQATFTAGSVNAWGSLQAVRVM